jgi:hypothetical protein
MLREKRRPEDRPLSVALFVAKCESPAQAEGLGGATLEACRGVWGATKGCFKPKLLALIRQSKRKSTRDSGKLTFDARGSRGEDLLLWGCDGSVR